MKRSLFALLAMTLIATGAFAQQHGRRGGGPGDGGMGPGGGGGNFLVTSSGTVIIRTAAGLSAINSSGATVWTATLADARGHLVLSGNNLLVVTDTSTSTSTSSTISAISTATGSTAWTLNVDGHVGQLEAFSGGTYAIVSVPPATRGGTGTRSLVAISNSGSILWSVAL